MTTHEPPHRPRRQGRLASDCRTWPHRQPLRGWSAEIRPAGSGIAQPAATLRVQNAEVIRGSTDVKPVLRLSPLQLSLVLVCSTVGGLVLTGFVALTVLPLLVGLGFLAVWVVALLLLGWAGIEALAAFERWLETSPRVRR